MKCPKCQHENAVEAKFCEECAAPLARVCANCGARLSPTAKFCSDCAHPVGQAAPFTSSSSPRFDAPEAYTPKYLAEKILTSKSALEGERKQVTVLFADLKGSMELLADRDPEEARKLLDPVLERMMAAVHGYEGTVNQVMGDGIMALFGAPVAHEDHAVRACYAALRMQESVKRYAEDVRRSHAAVVKIRVGLNSGIVVVRAIGSDLDMDYTAVGLTTHLAARMEQIADPGAIVITPDTLALAEGYVEVKSLGPVSVKGLAEAVEVYEVTGAGPARTRLEASAERGLTRFVGRDAELEQLRRALKLADAGRGQVAAIFGEAGVGKSRLIYEFTHSHRLQSWLVLESISVSYGKATSYLPVIALLKAYFKIQDSDDLRELRAKVTGAVLTLDEALKGTLPALLALLEVPVDDPAWLALDPAQRRQHTLDAVRRLLLRETREQPLLLVFEDLHWIDSETQALLDGLVESLGSARLLLLVNYRPEYQHAWGNKTYYSQIRLDALPAESTGELLEALLGKDPELTPLKQLLVRRGNPFFLEETVRTLAQTQALTGERGRYRLSHPVQAIQIPSTVQTMLAARIDRLPPEDKHLLQVASVIGKDVPLALLQPIADLPDEALRRGLDHLKTAEFIYEIELYPHLEYSFTHALTHEVTYGGLLKARRRALHARVVDAIETLHRERLGEQTERLAQHAVRGELWEKAVHYLRQAGLKAASRSALQEGRVWFEQALGILETLPESRENTELAMDIRFDLRNCLHPLGHLERILEHIRKVEVQAALLGDQRRLGQASSFLSQYHRLRGDLGPAIETGERAVAIADQVSDLPLWIVASTHLGAALTARGDHRRATEILTASVERSPGDLVGDTMGTTGIISVFSRIYLVSSLAELGEFAAATLHAEEAFQIAESANHVYSLACAYYGIGTVFLYRGDVPRSIAALERGLDLCRSWNLPLMLPLFGTSLGGAYCLAVRPDEAIGLLEETERHANSMQRRGGHAMLLTRLGEAYLQVLRVDDARRCARQAITLSREHTERGHEAHALRLLGDLGLDDPPTIDESETFYRQAIARAEELEMRPLLAQCYLGLGKRHRRVGRRTSADSYLNKAVALFRTLDMPFWLEQAQAQLASPP
jgi:class 3 adenylate cyclase/tetratricopeptide (TPR) repeat protein